jgi:hypothetical protein
VTVELVHHERTSPKGLSTGCFAISHLGGFCPCVVGGEAGGAEMVGEQIFHFHDLRGGVFTRGDAGRPCEVVFRDE